MMPFKRLLNELMERIDGAHGAILADWEGESVEYAARMDGYQLKIIGAHQGVILHSLKEALLRLGEKGPGEIVISTAKTRTVVLPVTDEYFLVLTLCRSYPLGRSLFEARQCIARLRAEIV
jgi:predicted regulator of Ras-like GTPase activity (Roadblock/LC7/MglB family)